jgi:hypothetical protein
MIDKKTPHAEDNLIEIFKERGITEKHFPKIYAYYKHCFEELYQDEYINWTDLDYEETGDSAHKSALFVTDMFIETFLCEKAKGQSDEWSLAVANCVEDGGVVYYITYHNIKKTNPELAKQELLIHSRTFDGDENFIRHYIYLFEIVEVFKDLEKRAKKYSEIYKTKFALDKSQVYIHEYARLLSSGKYNPIFCEEYAYAYDKAIKEGKSEMYAREFAEEYGGALVDIKARYGISEDEELINYAIEKVDVYMTAWEYHEKHHLKNFKQFADIYENIYFNTYYPNEEMPSGTKEEIDVKILEKVLEQYKK